jgi:hypothetical protein
MDVITMMEIDVDAEVILSASTAGGCGKKRHAIQGRIYSY